MELLIEPSSERQFIMYEALRKGADVDTLSKNLYQTLVYRADEGTGGTGRRDSPVQGQTLPDELLIRAKKDGFADRYLSQTSGNAEEKSARSVKSLGIVKAWEAVPVSGVENAAYYYSTYNAPDKVPAATNERSWFSAAGPTASARESNSTTAASTPPLPCATKAMNPLWSTAIRKPFQPITTPPTNSILNRSLLKTSEHL